MGYQISELSVSVTRFKLFAFWARHMWRTCRPSDDWTDISWDEVSILKNQKTLKDNLQDWKTPEFSAMPLNSRSSRQIAGDHWNSPCIRPTIHPEEPK